MCSGVGCRDWDLERSCCCAVSMVCCGRFLQPQQRAAVKCSYGSSCSFCAAIAWLLCSSCTRCLCRGSLLSCAAGCACSVSGVEPDMAVAVCLLVICLCKQLAVGSTGLPLCAVCCRLNLKQQDRRWLGSILDPVAGQLSGEGVTRTHSSCH
jgi:hypothetical protein